MCLRLDAVRYLVQVSVHYTCPYQTLNRIEVYLW
jgi:hypothetical protein